MFQLKETAHRAWNLVPESVTNSKVATRAQRAARERLPGATRPRIVRTLTELDECLALLERAAEVSDDELRRGFATFRMELDLDLPDDPFSDEYRQSVFDLYEWLHGAPYTPRNEFTLFELERYTDVPFPYATQSGATVGNYLIGMGHIIRTLNLAPQSRVLEFGPGFGNVDDCAGPDGPPRDRGRHRPELRRSHQRARGVGAHAGRRRRRRLLDGARARRHNTTRCCSSSASITAPTTSACSSGLDRVVAPGGRVFFAGEPIAKIAAGAVGAPHGR